MLTVDHHRKTQKKNLLEIRIFLIRLIIMSFKHLKANEHIMIIHIPNHKGMKMLKKHENNNMQFN